MVPDSAASCANMLLLMLMLKASQAVFWSVVGWQFPVLSVLTLHRADRTDKLHANPILAGMLELVVAGSDQECQ